MWGPSEHSRTETNEWLGNSKVAFKQEIEQNW